MAGLTLSYTTKPYFIKNTARSNVQPHNKQSTEQDKYKYPIPWNLARPKAAKPPTLHQQRSSNYRPYQDHTKKKRHKSIPHQKQPIAPLAFTRGKTNNKRPLPAKHMVKPKRALGHAAVCLAL